MKDTPHEEYHEALHSTQAPHEHLKCLCGGKLLLDSFDGVYRCQECIPPTELAPKALDGLRRMREESDLMRRALILIGDDKLISRLKEAAEKRTPATAALIETVTAHRTHIVAAEKLIIALETSNRVSVSTDDTRDISTVLDESMAADDILEEALAAYRKDYPQ